MSMIFPVRLLNRLLQAFSCFQIFIVTDLYFIIKDRVILLKYNEMKKVLSLDILAKIKDKTETVTELLNIVYIAA